MYILKSKKLVQKHMPFFYPFIYRTYFALTHSKTSKTRIAKYSQFVNPGFYPFVLDDIIFDLKLDPANCGVDTEIFADKNYEPEILRHIRSNLRDTDVFIDIGANIGQHSLYASYFCRHVYAFEPIGKLYNQCVESVFKNDILNVSTYNYGLGNETKDLPIYSNGSSMAASSIYATKNKKFIQNIRIRRFDDIYRAIGIEKADMIKIDVEGYELEVLLGAREFIAMFKPLILTELSPYFYRRLDESISNKILDFLIGMGYELYDLIEHTNRKVRVYTLEDINNKDQTNLLCMPKKS